MTDDRYASTGPTATARQLEAHANWDWRDGMRAWCGDDEQGWFWFRILSINRVLDPRGPVLFEGNEDAFVVAGTGRGWVIPDLNDDGTSGALIAMLTTVMQGPCIWQDADGEAWNVADSPLAALATNATVYRAEVLGEAVALALLDCWGTT